MRLGGSGVVMVVASFVACAPDYSGDWVGSDSYVGEGVCSDGSSVGAGTEGLEWTVIDRGNTVTFETMGHCGMFDGTRKGEEISLDSKDCTPYSANGSTILPHQESGTVRFTNGTMAIETFQSVTTDTAMGTSATCRIKYFGVLARLN